MAETLGLKQRLSKIASSEIHSSYQLGTSLLLVRALAKLVSTLVVDGLIPDGGPNAYKNYNWTSQSQNSTGLNFAQRLISVQSATEGVQTTMESLSREPADSSQRVNQQNNFLLWAERFIEGWSVLYPALQANIGNSFLDEIRMVATETQSIKSTLDGLLEAARNSVADIGVSKHTGQFLALSQEYRRNAIRALVCTISIAVVFIIGVVASTEWTISVSKIAPAELAQIVVSRVLALSILYFLIVLSARSYRSNAHLAAINRHRATALQTFETFATSSTDEQTKNAILLETTRCIYSHTSTGFVGADDSTAPLQIVEILKALGPTK